MSEYDSLACHFGESIFCYIFLRGEGGGGIRPVCPSLDQPKIQILAECLCIGLVIHKIAYIKILLSIVEKNVKNQNFFCRALFVKPKSEN